jgi:peptidoglycan/xylan/chitin deacetylase (PgdA/CDA1 family)
MNDDAAASVVPVLLYHAVGTDRSDWIAPYTVTVPTFRRHLELVAASGRVALSVEELRLAMIGELRLSCPAVVITFDDGFVELADVVAAELARWQLPATMFLTTGFVGGRSPGGDRMLSWNGIRELVDAGHEIGAHSVTHPQLDLLRSSAAEHEVRDCRLELQDQLDLPVPSFAYPHGYSNRRVRELVRTAGYESACSVKNALSHWNDARYSLSRLTVTARTPDSTVRHWLSGTDARIGRADDRLIARAWRGYRRGRSRLQGSRVDGSRS